MENVLDNILGGMDTHANIPTKLAPRNLVHFDAKFQDQIRNNTGFATRMATRGGNNYPAFRGQLADVQGLTGVALMDKAGINWPTESYTPVINGVPADDFKGLVRGDTGTVLSITSAKFKPHQNTDMLETMNDMCEAGDARMVMAGALDGGRKIVAIAAMNGEFSLPDKTNQNKAANHHAGDAMDTTQCFALVSGGHEPGTPFVLRGMAYRRWCANGVFFSATATAKFRVTHRGRLTAAMKDGIRATYDAIRAQFEVYGRDANAMLNVEMNTEQNRLYIAELLAPGAVAEVQAKLGTGVDVFQEVAQSVRGREALRDVIKAHADDTGFAVGAKLKTAMVEQIGGNGNTLWNAYNGVTWFVDHKRGHNPQTGVEAALFGAGATLKERALTVAREFVTLAR